MAPAGYTASPAFPWTDSGGIITLAEPLSLEELQTGALVLRVRRDGAEAVDAVGVPVIRPSDQSLVGLEFYCYGEMVAQLGNGSDYQAGVFEINWTNRGYSWEIVGARVDKQFWHGGVFVETGYWVNSSGQGALDGQEALFRCSLSLSNDTSEVPVTLSVGDAVPLGGLSYGGAVKVTDNAASVSNGASFSKATFSPNWKTVKAVPMLSGGQVYLKVLYPGDGWECLFQLFDSNGAVITSLSTQGPFYMSDI